MSLSPKAPFAVTLDDGTMVRLRPVKPEDRDRIRRAYERLSPASRRNRFWEERDQLSPERADSLSATDDRNHLAWIALHREDDDFPGYGGASSWRDPDNPERAEISFTVADEKQRSGIGTLLLSILWYEAWQRGIREFHGIARKENFALAEWFSSLGAGVTFGTRHLEVRLDLIAPEALVAQVAYGSRTGSRRVILADWMQDWLAMEREASPE